jgi:[ribosomal protein S18]-alanine N-acetyltransferase
MSPKGLLSISNHAIKKMMITQVQSSVRPVTSSDRQKLANLIHFEILVHRHLDWRPPLDWVGYQPFLMIEQNKNLIAALACPPDPPNVAWIRLFAASSSITAERAWRTLWPVAVENLVNLKEPVWAAAIPLQHWFQTNLEESGFIETHRVVMLSWEQEKLPPAHSPSGVILRPMTLDDMANVEKIDRAAFVEVWQNSRDSLELAFRQAAVATVAEVDGQLVGYQISTATSMGGHLARLAVYPEYQGNGIGYILVHDLLSQFERRGAQVVTVNTQQDNQASLSLYRHIGFHLTGEEYPIYQFDLR